METNPLGQTTDYPKAFDPSLLFPIPRAQARENLGLTLDSNLGLGEGEQSTCPFVGYDEWTLYELCWRDRRGSIEVVVGVLRVPCSSEFIVESKSLKLYINSLYYQAFDSRQSVVDRVVSDLSKCLGTTVEFSLYALDELPRYLSEFDFIERKSFTGDNGLFNGYRSLDSEIVNVANASDISLVSSSPADGLYRYKTSRFRSLCPVTGQPDWASIYLCFVNLEVDMASLAQYLVGFSEHQGFHENCVERIYTELNTQLSPEELSVSARYTRRGGIDINPIRASALELICMPAREIRQ